MKINKADKWFSIFIRLRDSDENGYVKCVTCKRVNFWKNIDCGHHFKRQYQSLRYNEKNCAGQCKHCNCFEQGRDADFKIAIIEKYGQREYDLLESGKRQLFKRSKLELEFLAKEYQKKAIELAKIKGLTI
jgi:hypothetical protein